MNLGFLNSILRRRTDEESVDVQIDEPRQAGKTEPTRIGESDSRRFIARQAIFDIRRKVQGYELLFRTSWENSFRDDADAATRVMIADGVLYGFHDLTNGAPTFINCTRESLINGLVTLLPNSTVLEIQDVAQGDAEALFACKRYKSLGYKVALDNIDLHEGMTDLIELANYVKVDFQLSGRQQRQQILNGLKNRNVTLVAMKIETEEEFDTAVAEGFTLFQGFYFSHPAVFVKKKMPTNGAHYLYLLSALMQDDFQIEHIAQLLQPEVALSYQLLRLVNSVSFGLEQEVRSLESALFIVGETKFRILLLNAIATETCRNGPSGLLLEVLHRARFLELMSTYTRENPMEQYLFGLLSLMDVMLGMPIADIVDALPMRSEMKDALCGEPNSVSQALRLFESYEAADWEQCMNESFVLQLTESELSGMYRDALVWAENSIRSDSNHSKLTQ